MKGLAEAPPGIAFLGQDRQGFLFRATDEPDSTSIRPGRLGQLGGVWTTVVPTLQHLVVVVVDVRLLAAYMYVCNEYACIYTNL